MSYSKEELIQYRIERAREAFADAEYLVSEERWNAAANRMYCMLLHCFCVFGIQELECCHAFRAQGGL